MRPEPLPRQFPHRHLLGIAGLTQDEISLLLDVSEKKQEARPASAEDLARGLEACDSSGRWSRDDARAWWEANPAEADVEEGTDTSASQPTLFRVDLNRRGGSRSAKPS